MHDLISVPAPARGARVRAIVGRTIAVLIGLVLAGPTRAADVVLPLSSNDVVAVLGGEEMVAWQKSGYFETLLAAQLGANGPRVRYLAWEGDTVFAQPRDLNFPPWSNQLQRVGATVVVCQFGAAEALRGQAALPEFVRAYEKLLDTLAAPNRRFVLLSPTPFENPGGALPDLSARNADLGAYVDGIRSLADRRRHHFVDLFTPLRAAGAGQRLTRDGLHLNADGQWRAANATLGQLSFLRPTGATLALTSSGTLTPASWEDLRRTVIAKNQLWFDYWRPQNWAFLHGDRTEQPSSRDHRDPKIRWFPKELAQFLPLIAAKEGEIAILANRVAPAE